MAFGSQSFNLHLARFLKKTAGFKTANNFAGFYRIDAKQTISDQNNLRGHEEYLRSFEINRETLFRNKPTSESQCVEADRTKKPRFYGSREFVSPLFKRLMQ